MQRISLGNITYRYLVGPHTIGIISPSRKKFVTLSFTEIREAIAASGRKAVGDFDQLPGSTDQHITPVEIATYILATRFV